MNNKKPESKLSMKPLLLICALAALVLAAMLLTPGNIHDTLTVEAGRDTISANEFRKEDKGIDAQFLGDISAIDLNTIGQYPVQVQYKDKTYDCTVVVEDTIAPQAKVHNISLFSNQTLAAEDFVSDIIDASPVTVSLKEQPDLTTEAQMLVTVVLTDAAGNTAEYEAVLTVFVDNGYPQLTGITDLFTFLGTEPDYLAGVSAMDDRDLDLTILVDKSQVDLNAAGIYQVIYSVTDAAGNTTTQTASVTVTDDNTPPTILGVHNLSLYLGSAVSYRKGVEVKDDKDPAPTLEIDSSKVDLSNPGVYPLIYTARDETGNETRIEVTVTVAEKPASFVDEEVIYAKVDELLMKIVSDDMTDEAKVKAIYAHMRSRYSYANHSDKTDWLQGAYVMMTEGQGDCFNYFALTKLMLERLNIANIDVRKVPNSATDSNHYWSLVSVDGGQTYYHLDTTPRVGEGDDFCLVTDAFLDAYSNAHKKCHNRDKSLYPATPEE